MKAVTVEVEINLPDRMDDESVTDAVDHMLDAGAADMAVEVSKDAEPPVIDQAIAEDCVEMDVGDAKVVESSENQPEPRYGVVEIAEVGSRLKGFLLSELTKTKPPKQPK